MSDTHTTVTEIEVEDYVFRAYADQGSARVEITCPDGTQLKKQYRGLPSARSRLYYLVKEARAARTPVALAAVVQRLTAKPGPKPLSEKSFYLRVTIPAAVHEEYVKRAAERGESVHDYYRAVINAEIIDLLE